MTVWKKKFKIDINGEKV